MSAGEFSGTITRWGEMINRAATATHADHLRSPGKSYIDKLTELITSDYRLHKRLLAADAVSVNSLAPTLYIRTVATLPFSSESSSASMRSISDSFYNAAFRQLEELKSQQDDDGDPVVEEGALDTAKDMLEELHRADYAPPELSWHGGDAVVMLWSAGATTFAITVTEGEWGYVVRRDHKQVREADSLRVTRQSLPMLTHSQILR